MDIGFPCEFIVKGTAVSLQTKRRESLEMWKERIVGASRSVLPEGHFATDRPMSVTLFYFPGARMEGDIDNIVKPVLDALTRHIYLDDRQVERLLVQKFEPGGIFAFESPSAALRTALTIEKPVLYVRLSDDPFEDLA